MKYQEGKNYVADETSNCLGKMLIISGLSFHVSVGASVQVLWTLYGIIVIVMMISLCDLVLPSVVQLLNDIRI